MQRYEMLNRALSVEIDVSKWVELLMGTGLAEECLREYLEREWEDEKS